MIMTKIMKKLPAVLLAAVIAVAFAFTIGTITAQEAYADEYLLWIGDTQVTDNNCNDLETNHWSYSAETKTLMLQDFSVSDRGHVYNSEKDAAAAIYYNGQDNLTISLSGTNCITMVPRKDKDCGIVSANANSTLTFSGTGSLTITSAGKGGRYNFDAAIYSEGPVTFSNGTIKVGTEEANYGVYNKKTATIGTEATSFDAVGWSGAFFGPVQNAVVGIGYYDQGGKEKADVIDIHETPVSLTYTPLWGSPGPYREVSFPRSQFTLEFAPNGGSGEMESWTVTEGETITLPECGFDPPEITQLFSKWDVTGVDLIGTPGTELLIARNCLLGGKITAEARWVERTQVMALDKPKGNDLTYNGESQELVTQGIPWRGTMLFAIGDSDTTAPDDGWSESIPKGTGAGTYHVWFMVKATFSGNTDSDPEYVAAEIKKKPLTITAATVAANNRTYDGTEKPLVTVDDSTLTGGTMQYALGTATEATEAYTTSIPTATEAGTYYVWYKIVGDANHADTVPACVTATINHSGGTDDPVQQVVDKINALTEPYDETKVKEARNAYDDLSDTQKEDERLTEEVMKKLANAEAAVKSAKDQEAAKNVSDQIKAIPEDLSQVTSDQVSGAVEAYNSLTPDQKKLITDSELAKLQAALNYPAKALTVKLTSVKAKKGKKAIAKWEENTSGNGYQLYYKAKGVKAKKVMIDGKDTLKKKVKKLKASKKYTFKVRTFTKIQNLAGPEESINVYGKWSNVKKVKVKR